MCISIDVQPTSHSIGNCPRSQLQSVKIFSVICANTFTLKTFKLLKFLKVLKKFLKNTTFFGQYGHPQVLKYLVGETAAISCFPSICTYVVLGVLLPVIPGCPFRFLMH
jgi:hypothetical protein